MTERDRLLEALRVARDRAMWANAGVAEIKALNAALAAWRVYETRKVSR